MPEAKAADAPAIADLHIAGIAKSFGSVRVLEDINLTIPDGQFVTLLGPSGCGKTTLLRIIAGFELPDRGSVRLGEIDLLRLPPNRRPVNTVFQSYALFPHLSVSDNVAFGLRARRLPEADVRKRTVAMLEAMRIGELRDRRPLQLSGGQRQRVALARALVNEPEVLLLDEPMSALDARLRHDLQGELKRLQRTCKITFLLVTHDQDEAIAVSDRILIMSKGHIVQDGTPEQVYERPISRFVAEFMGSANVIAVSSWRDDHGAVATTAVGEIRLSTIPSWTSGHIAIRPEDIEVREVAGPACLPAQIEDRMFRGDHWELVLAFGRERLRVKTEPDQHHTVGQWVWAELPHDDVLVLAE
jgi:spermidine/putrescine transport system ATP-binding protein